MKIPESGISRPVAAPDYKLVAELCRRSFGFRLLTVLQHCPGKADVMRTYSTNPEAYPIGMPKPMGPTPWGRVVLEQGLGWHGEGEAAVRWAFPDAEKILSLGCESCLCVPVLHEGQTLAVLSLNDVGGAYRVEDLDPLSVLAQLLTGPLTASVA